MKIYQKKDASLEDETALVQLARRHTVKEIPDDMLTEDRKTTRTKSLGVLAGSQSSTDVEATTAEKKSGFKRRPTVITESELASSSLYKDRKAKINSDDESIDDPKPTMPSEKHEDLEPRTLQDPNLKPVPVSIQRPRKPSSCCWYFAIILVIFIACLAVMAGVGGIVYMEYFATYKKVDMMDAPEENEKIPSESKEIFQHPRHKQENLHLNEPKIPENTLNDLVKNSAILVADAVSVRKLPLVISQPNRDSLGNKDLSDSSDIKTKALDHTKSSFVPESQDIEFTEHSDSDNFRDNRGRIRLFKGPFKEKSLEIKNNAKDQDTIDLKLNNQKNEDIMNEVPEMHADGATGHNFGQESSIDGNSDSITEFSDSTNGKLTSKKINIGEKSTLATSTFKADRTKKDVSFQNLSKENDIGHLVHTLPNDGSLKSINIFVDNNIGNSSSNHSINHSLDISFQNLLKENDTEHLVHPLPNEESLENINIFVDNSIGNSSSNHFINHSTLDDNFLDQAEHIIDPNLEDNSLNQREHSIAHNREDHVENFINKSIEDDSLGFTEEIIDLSLEEISLNNAVNSIGHSVEEISSDNTGHSIDHDSEENQLDLIEPFPHNNKSLIDHKNDSNEFETADSVPIEHSITDDLNKKSDDPDNLVFIRPVVESNPVPVNVEFLKRMGIDIKNPNNRQPMTAEDMDIKFSLAEALKFLRSLDTDNKLPVSREKTVSKKTSNQEKRNSVKLPLTAERKGYLNILRKMLF